MLKLFLSSFSVVMIGAGFAFISQLLLARFLSAEEYGIYSFIFSFSLLLSVFSMLGLQNGLVRLIPTLRDKDEDAPKIRHLIGFSRALTFVLACLVGAVSYGLLYLVGLSGKYPQESMVIGIVLVPLMVLLRLNAAILRGYEHGALSLIYETTLREGLFFLTLVALFVFGAVPALGQDALSIMICVLALSVALSFVQCAALVREKHTPQRVSREDYSHWLKTSFPMMMILFAQRFLRRADIVFLGIMVQPALVGAYAIAAQFSEGAAIGQKGVFAIFAARAARLYQSGEKEELKNLYRRVTLYGIASCGLMCVLVACIAPFLYDFFGAGFDRGHVALLILLAGMFINVCFGPVGLLMMMSEYEVQAMKLTFMAMIGNIVLNPPAIYFFGLEGAAVTTSVFLISRAALSYRFVKKQGVL